MKILYFPKYTRKGASSRLRSYQYFPYLEAQGIEITVSPLFSDQYLENLYAHKSTIKWTLKAYIRRIFVLTKVLKYDKIVIEKELFPYLPACGELLLKLFRIKYIVDYDDAIFHNYDQNPNPVIRFFLKRKIDKVMKYSYTVIAGNDYLANRAKKAKAKNIQIIPTAIDVGRYRVKKHEVREQVVIGWIGSQSTFKYLLLVKDVLQRLIKEYNILIHIVGTKESLGLGENEIHIEWSEETEVASILNFDIGIMPLSYTLWEQGKCAYKLIQYMGCGLPVVASPVGMNNEVVRDGYSGFFANSYEEWFNCLESYILNADLREIHGRLGRKIVTEKYCLEITCPKTFSIFEK